ncbi:MAG: ATP-binding cassette domain-containing protein [Verrucomicrobiota bacterium]|nr:ATP-binding cassette domain-containing protein [Verrucomicrobiota bacterium]
MAIIDVNNLTKVYRTYKKKPGLGGALRGLVKRDYISTRAADSISFSIQEGELVGFLGPNGAGKTTVLKMLSGLLFPTSGSATVLGHTPWKRENAFKKHFALIMGQKNALWWDLPAEESLDLSRVIYGVQEDVFRKRLDELTQLLDVHDKLNVMVRELSLGERMKFELINALIHSPKVLFLDEPTIGLDVTSQKKVRDFLKQYTKEKKITSILTSHYMQDIQELCERVIIIDHGQMMYDGKLANVMAKFADYKMITLQCEGGFNRTQLEAYGEIVELEHGRARLKVSREKAVGACRDILATVAVSDFTIQEVPVEDVIREFFAEKHRLIFTD